MINYFVQHHNNFESKQPNQTIRRSWKTIGKTDVHFLSVLKLTSFYVLKNVNTKSLIKFKSTA